MVKLTVDLIAKQIPGLRKRRADESVESQLSRLTHLPLQHRTIDAIVTQNFCFSLLVRQSTLFLGRHSAVPLGHRHLSLRELFEQNRKFELRREFDASLLAKQPAEQIRKSALFDQIEEIVSGWKSNRRARRFRIVSRVDRSLHRKSTLSRRRKTSLRSANDRQFGHCSR